MTKFLVYYENGSTAVFTASSVQEALTQASIAQAFEIVGILNTRSTGNVTPFVIGLFRLICGER